MWEPSRFAIPIRELRIQLCFEQCVETDKFSKKNAFALRGKLAFCHAFIFDRFWKAGFMKHPGTCLGKSLQFQTF